MINYKNTLLLLVIWTALFIPADHILAQPTTLTIAKSITAKEKMLAKTPATDLLNEVPAPDAVQQKQANNLKAASYLRMNEQAVASILDRPAELLKLQLPNPTGESFNLELERADVFSADFKVYAASDRSRPIDYRGGAYYWGIIDGNPNSLAAISIIDGEISGLIHLEGATFNLGRMEGKNDGLHVLYRNTDLQQTPSADCFTDDDEHYIGGEKNEQPTTGYAKAQDNCVRMYVEVDYDIYVARGGVSQAADYISAVFNQVSLLYANEAINLVLNEVVVWDITDPYTGTSTSNYLTQFRNNINGTYNGDLAHLVGYQGGGGIAYLNVLCNSFYGVGYSDINSTYNNVPTYSWTVEVLTHEIGHNLGSSHTHACAWNGNNTAIDGCGPAAGYSEGCDNGPIPNDGGTIMSYCHLVGGVGINFLKGFGPQPGDRIRDRVYNASCLVACGPPPANDAAITNISAPTGTICTSTVTPSVELTNYGTTALESVTIIYEVDGATAGSYNWTGSLEIGNSTQVSLPALSNYNVGGHSFTVSTDAPNGAADEDPANDAASSSFSYALEQVYYADADGDGFGNPNVSLSDCVAPVGYVSDNTDCNDNNRNAYPGAPCNDGDACTTGDVLDANCNCAGTFTDSDNDTVCDAEDVCPGGDDLQDTDGNGIPDACDCNAAIASFASLTLDHSGTGSSSISFSFEPNSKDASFTISGFDREISGNPRGRYAELVTITYVDGNGNPQTYGTSDGGSSGSVTVNIPGGIQSVEISLTDGYDGSAPVALSVNLSDIDYCAPFSSCPDADNDGICDVDDVCPELDNSLIGTPCDDGIACTINDVYGPDCNCAGVELDSDGDGVCDGEDICPVGDDNIDTDGDGIPDACDPSNCAVENTMTTNFASPVLQYNGGDPATASVSFGTETHSGINFTISGLDARTNGNPNSRYAEEVTISYTDALGATVIYGTYNGENTTTVNVNIPEVVLDITVSLRDAYNGLSSNMSLSVTLGSIISCASFPESFTNTGRTQAFKLYPNPATGYTMLQFGETLEDAQVVIHNLLGAQVASYQVREQAALRINTQEWPGQSQVYLVTVQLPNGETMTKRLIVTR